MMKSRLKFTVLQGEELESLALLTAFTPVLLSELAPGEASAELSDFLPLEEFVLFNARQDELWLTDGTPDGTEQLGVAKLGAGHIATQDIVLFNATAEDSPAVWRTDGTAAGTFELIPKAKLEGVDSLRSPDYDRYPTVETDDFTLFNVDSQVYRSDGTVDGTFPLLADKSLSHSQVVESGSDLFRFVTLNATDAEFWQTDGTPQLTTLEQHFFTDEQQQPWVSGGNGSAAIRLTEESSLAPFRWVASVGDKILATRGSSIWQVGDTPQSLFQLGGTWSYWIGNRNGRAYVASEDFVSIMSTDGDQAKSIAVGDVGSARFLGSGRLVFNDVQRDGPSAFHVIDENDSLGTLATGAIAVEEVSQVGNVAYAAHRSFGDRAYALNRNHAPIASPSSRPTFLDEWRSSGSNPRWKPIDSPLFYVAEGGLWALDGGAFSQYIGEFDGDGQWQYTQDGFLYAGSVGSGIEPIVSDGTQQGTHALDLWPGAGSSNPQFVNWTGGTLIIADTPDHGGELWGLVAADALRVEVDPFVAIDEGQQLLLSAAIANAIGKTQFAWDINNDGSFDEVVGESPTIEWAQLHALLGGDANGNHHFAVQATDSVGQTSTKTGTLRINNLPPIIEPLPATQSAIVGRVVEFKLAATDVDSLEYTIEYGDGAIEIEDNADSVVFRKSFDAAGIYSVVITVRDSDGAEAKLNQQVAVRPANPASLWIYQPGHVFGGGAFSVDVDIADFSGDGFPDVFETVHDGPDRLWNYSRDLNALNWRSSRLEPYTTRRSVYSSVGDFDNDDRIDIAIASFDGLELLTGVYNHVWNGSTPLGDPTIRSYDVAVGDLDGDGYVDLFVANLTDSEGQPASDRVFLNRGTQDGLSDTNQALGRYKSRSVELGDIDGDGDLDAVMATLDNGNVVWLNDGHGMFTESPEQLEPSGEHVAFGDLDQDGDLDLFGASAGANHIWLNDGNGHFTDSGQRIGSANSSHVALGDLDLDGDLDAVVANWENDANMIWLNDGEAVFSDSGARLAASASTEHIALVDLDLDNDLDVVAASFGSANHIYFNMTNVPDRTPPQFTGASTQVENGMLASLTLAFDDDVSASFEPGPANIELRNNATGERSIWPQRMISSSWEVATNSIRFDLSELGIGVGEYDLVLAPAIRDTSGNLLDGDGDGVEGGPVLENSILVTWRGDSDADLDVDFADFLTLSQNFGRSDADRSMGDFDGDGVVNFADFLLLSANFGRSVDVAL